jgi:quercetin dioxygenase-like cupin family protein
MSSDSNLGLSGEKTMNPCETSIDKAHEASQATSRRGFLSLAAALAVGGQFVGSPATAADGTKVTITDISRDSVTDAEEPIVYLETPNPEISSSIVTIPPGTTTEWMTHPVQGYVYVLEGTLIVEFADGPRMVFKSGRGFPQARSKWHRGRNDGEGVVRFLAVFFGGKHVPNVLNPPKAH